MSAGQAVFSDRSAFLSSIVRAMAFLLVCVRYIATFVGLETAGSGIGRSDAKRRALVVGGSMSGLLAALMLRRAGWDVDIYERVESELSGRGAGIVAQPDLIERIRRLGIDPTDLGVAITTPQDPRCRGPPGLRARMPAGAGGLGAGLPRAARRVSAARITTAGGASRASTQTGAWR